MHECEEAEQAVIVGIEIAIVEGLVLRIPECIDKRLALLMGTHHRGSSRCGYEADAVAQFTEATGSEDFITLRQCTVRTILVEEGIDAL